METESVCKNEFSYYVVLSILYTSVDARTFINSVIFQDCRENTNNFKL